MIAIGTVAMLLGAGFALAYYRPAPADAFQARVPVVFSYLTTFKELFDRLYDWYVAKVQQRFAMVLNFLDQVVLQGLIRLGAGALGLVSLGVRALHVGTLHAYVYWFLLGVALLWGFAIGSF
jgi:NADH-quinone oxidoreductase subunit L